MATRLSWNDPRPGETESNAALLCTRKRGLHFPNNGDAEVDISDIYIEKRATRYNSRENVAPLYSTAILIVYSIGVVLAGLFHHYILRLDNGNGALFLVGCMAVLGIPHGALDVYVARHLGLMSNRANSLRFLGLYVSAAGVVLALWVILPVAALSLFLLLSAYHFAEDWEKPLGPIGGACMGASIIIAPALFHSQRVGEIFYWLAGEGSASLVELLALSSPLMAIAAFYGIRRWQAGNCKVLVEVVLIFSSAMVLSPLAYFAILFCLLHTPRHVVSVFRKVETRYFGAVAVSALPWALVAIGMVIILALLLPSPTLSTAGTAALFMILSALTVPHTWLIAKLNHR